MVGHPITAGVNTTSEEWGDNINSLCVVTNAAF